MSGRGNVEGIAEVRVTGNEKGPLFCFVVLSLGERLGWQARDMRRRDGEPNLELVVGLGIRLVRLMKVSNLPSLKLEVPLGVCGPRLGIRNKSIARGVHLLATRSFNRVISEVASRMMVVH